MSKSKNAGSVAAHPITNATYRPEDLASALGISGKLVRGFLRSTFTRPVETKGTTWVLTNEQAKATYDHFIAKRSPVQPNAEAVESN